MGAFIDRLLMDGFKISIWPRRHRDIHEHFFGRLQVPTQGQQANAVNSGEGEGQSRPFGFAALTELTGEDPAFGGAVDGTPPKAASAGSA